MTLRTCPVCGDPVESRTGRGRRPLYCSAECKADAQVERRRAKVAPAPRRERLGVGDRPKGSRLTIVRTFIAPRPYHKSGHSLWVEARCDCGVVIRRMEWTVYKGDVRSCGCLRSETARLQAEMLRMEHKARREARALFAEYAARLRSSHAVEVAA